MNRGHLKPASLSAGVRRSKGEHRDRQGRRRGIYGTLLQVAARWMAESGLGRIGAARPLPPNGR